MMEERHFTLDEASQMLPWLETKFQELEPYRFEVDRCRTRVAELLVKSRGNGHGGNLDEELHRLESMAQELQKSIEDIVGQITARGIIVRDLDKGLVDFPALRQGRTIHLCWIRGETDISFWHETDSGFAGRQPL